MGQQPYPFHDGANVAWELVVWSGERDRVVVAALGREVVLRIREHFDRGDDVWMFDVYPVPPEVLPEIEALVPGLRLDPAREHHIEATQNLPDGCRWPPEPGGLPPGHVPPP
ncbi:hypothetical protein ACFY00_29420 [Kitasatospora sp. NPDC001540]|uniref:hypothetical protein n=1 Tax=Kitasatospora sp. NPDC001540 TaxID=3364014 RepID=UPI0036C84C2F